MRYGPGVKHSATGDNRWVPDSILAKPKNYLYYQYVVVAFCNPFRISAQLLFFFVDRKINNQVLSVESSKWGVAMTGMGKGLSENLCHRDDR
jgi:hypothetical protein